MRNFFLFLVVCCQVANSFTNVNNVAKTSRSQYLAHLQMSSPTSPSFFSNEQMNNVKKIFASALVFGSLMAPVIAADYAPASAPPTLVPQVARSSPKALQSGPPAKWIYSKFLDEVEKNNVEKVTFSPDGKKALAIDDDGDRYTIDIPNDPNLLSFLVQNKVEINVAPISANGNTGAGSDAMPITLPDSDIDRLLQTFIIPGVLTAGIFLYPAAQILFPSKEQQERNKANKAGNRTGQRPGGFRPPNPFGGGGRPGQGGGRGPGGMDPEQFAKSKAKLDLNPVTNTNFADVAGCDSAKIELEEVVDFLKNPDTYTEMGAKIPKGCLLYGPPGTGKTLLARAVAGEAGVPFISVSGSEFVQVFVGVGAARVRDLFKTARENAPCIVFIDEIDAVGRARGGASGGNDEREQTLNQLLVEMDGFDGNVGVITIAATNRLDILDEALTRAGRFDRKIEITLPDARGRLDVLKVHARNKPLAPDIDLDQVARRTPGLSGASLKNLLNEAAIHAARDDKNVIDWDDVDWAIDRVTVGQEKSNKDALIEDIELVAFHEAGHAIVGGLIPEYDTVTKISIVPRTSGAGGLTFFSPLEDRIDNVVTRHYLESQLAVAWGGRVAEELVFGQSKVTTGASGDLQQIFRIARAMVCQLGMSRLPPLAYDFPAGNEADLDWQLSAWLKERINSEILRLTSNGYYLAKKILTENEDLLWGLARRLIQEDQVSQEEFHFMLYEYNAKTEPYALYGDTKIDEMPYQNDPNALAEDLFKSIPKFSAMIPKVSELKDANAISQLPELLKRYQEDEAAELERMRKPNPLESEDWGKSKMELVSEALKYKQEEDRKEKLKMILEAYQAEEKMVKELKAKILEKEAAVKQLMDAGVN